MISETPAQLNIPNEVYYIAGALLLTNIGTIISVVFAAVKVVWWAAKADSRIDEARAMAARAHKRIDAKGGVE